MCPFITLFSCKCLCSASSGGYGRHWEKWNNKHGAGVAPPQGVVIMNLILLVILRMPLLLCKVRLHVLLRLPDWSICWNIRSADLHPPGPVEMWYEWNLHTQDVLFQWNMSMWIHFSAQKVSSASPYTHKQKFEEDCFISLLLFCDWLLPSCFCNFNQITRI